MEQETRGTAGFTWQQLVVLIVGSFYMLLGILGFFFLRDASAPSELGGHDTNDVMLGFELNGVQNVVHLILGLVGLACATGRQRSRLYGILIAVAGLALFVFGVIAVGRDDINVLSLNWPDNILHGVTGLIGVALAVAPTTVRHRESADPERAT
jgi:hypothetical protein